MNEEEEDKAAAWGGEFESLARHDEKKEFTPKDFGEIKMSDPMSRADEIHEAGDLAEAMGEQEELKREECRSAFWREKAIAQWHHAKSLERELAAANEAKSPISWPLRSGATVAAMIAAASGFAIARPTAMITRKPMSDGYEKEVAVSIAPNA